MAELDSATAERLDLTIVVVNYNVRDLVASCLAALPAAVGGPPWASPIRSIAPDAGLAGVEAAGTRTAGRDFATLTAARSAAEAAGDGARPLRWEAVVVDSASTDGSAELVAAHFSWARLIRLARNRGYAAGVNMGLAAARGRHVAILNADTEPCPGSLATLMRYLDAHPDVGLVGPRLIYPDGTVQPSRRRFPTLATALFESTVLQQWFPNNPAVRHYYLADRPDEAAQPVDWLVGAALVVRWEAVAAVGGLDEGFFMYSEELEWARRLRAAGWAIHFVPEAEVLHHEGKSSEGNLPARHVQFQASKRRYFRLVYGRWVDPLLRGVIALNYLGRIGEELAKLLLSPRARAARRQRLRAYTAALLAQLAPDPAPDRLVTGLPPAGELARRGDAGPVDAVPGAAGAIRRARPGRGLARATVPVIPPHQDQHERGVSNDCGPYSASIALRRWRADAPAGSRVGRLIRLRLPGPARLRGATSPYGLKRFLAAQGCATRAGTRGRLDLLKRAVRAGIPTIVLVHPAGGQPLTRHYRVLVGYDDATRRLHFVDPGLPDARRDEPGNHSVDYATFRREWGGGGWGPLYRRWFLPVRPLPNSVARLRLRTRLALILWSLGVARRRGSDGGARP